MEYIYIDGQPSAIITSGSLNFIHNDHLGTPQQISDGAQSIVWQADYSPFGEATMTIELITNNLRFPGQYYDEETNLHYNWNRYYDPQLGRYITSDPIGLDGGASTYSYGYQNSVINYDPKGESVTQVVIGIGVAGLLYAGYKLKELGDKFKEGMNDHHDNADIIGDALNGDDKALDKINNSDKENYNNIVDAHDAAQGAASGNPASAVLGGTKTLRDLLGNGKNEESSGNLDPIADEIYEAFCKQNPGAPNCLEYCP